MKPRLRPWHIAVAIAVFTFVVFGESIGHDWVEWDDQVNIYQNPVLNLPLGESLARFWRAPYFSLYMPVTYSFWALLASVAHLPQPIMSDGAGIYSLDPRVFHAAGVLLHVVNALLVFVLLRRWADQTAAGIGALFFSVHPVQVEPVVWVTGMNNVLSATFGLLALIQYVSFAHAENRRCAARHYGVAFLCCVLALLAKPTAVALPFLALVLDYWAVGRPLRRVAPAILPWLAAAYLCILLTRGAQFPDPTPVNSVFWTRPFLVADSLAFYTLKVALPLRLGIDYGRTPAFVLEQAVRGGAVLWLIPLALTAVAWRQRGARPLLWTAWAIFCLALVPTSGLVSFYFHAFSLVADRYLYLALLGPALGLAVLMSGRGTGAKSAVCAVLVVLGVWSAFVGLNWSNSFTLFSQALKVNRRSWVAHTNYGGALKRRGDDAGALREFHAALEVNPSFAPARYALGVLLLKQGNSKAARTEWTNILREQPHFENARRALNNLSQEGK